MHFNLSGITPDEDASILFLADNQLQDTDGRKLARTLPNLTFFDLGNNIFTELKSTSFV